jgi:hypothetical protein
MSASISSSALLTSSCWPRVLPFARQRAADAIQREQQLDPARHNRKAFSCGVQALDRFLPPASGAEARADGYGGLPGAHAMTSDAHWRVMPQGDTAPGLAHRPRVEQGQVVVAD